MSSVNASVCLINERNHCTTLTSGWGRRLPCVGFLCLLIGSQSETPRPGMLMCYIYTDAGNYFVCGPSGGLW